MKKVVTVTEVEGEGLVSLLGENVLVQCENYHYYGKLVGVNESDIQLENASIVYETGPWKSAPKWSNSETLPAKFWYVRVAKIESYGVV